MPTPPHPAGHPLSDRPEPGAALQFRWRKWDGGRHWVNDCVYLGSDRWGDWLGQPDGWRNVRPGREMTAHGPNVTLVPPSGDFAMTVNGTPHRVRIYIDVAWDVRWENREPQGIDMDLDVVKAIDGRGLFIDDRDEWDEHRVAYGYPLDIVEKLETLALDLERRVGAGEAPFDDATADAWLARLAALPPVAPPPPADLTEPGAAGDGLGGPESAA
ncbi:DUF402 domain-containing protein [Microbacterium sp. M3]|uniref:DUF402 domain-containing protein n=2 Tax=Microbacterium arthrosphaerae TaxID=792652 RepID=A0ABU4GXH6_9MICO|nr:MULTISPECIES: DUF402 domain-containing protein [Microbacterium]MDW4571780.1 DUF402 domain-containing protein [Microbacterium arthrosphaerae]MDW7605635.1 DUF402 domain-containing protein [Microbacterium sp. M3]